MPRCLQPRPAVLRLVLLIAALATLAPVALAVSRQTTLTADTAYPPPPLTGSAALIYNLDTAQVLYSAHADKDLPVASTVKLMTALLVLEHGQLDTTTTVSYEAATIGQSTMYLHYGEVLSLRSLLYGLLLPSGNDAAIALAEAVGGSQAAFVAAMNARCKRLGCTHSDFTTPHGLDGYGGYSSAHDLLLILKADLRYGTFLSIVRTRTYVVPATAQNYEHDLTNVNEPLWWYPGVLGAKPGNTAAAGFCDVLYVVRGGKHIAAVILGMPDRYTDVRDLLNYAFGDFTWHSPATIPASLEDQLYPSDDFSQDSPDRYLEGSGGPGQSWRYYVGTGYYVRSPFLAYYANHPELGLPTSQATISGSTAVQRFGTTLLLYDKPTGTFTRKADGRTGRSAGSTAQRR